MINYIWNKIKRVEEILLFLQQIVAIAPYLL